MPKPTKSKKAIILFLVVLSITLTPITNSNAMPTISEVLFAPFKIITKPIQWLKWGWENKTDEYKVEITYNIEFDGKPLTITKAINCEIYEGQFRSSRDGIRRPTRKVRTTVNQIIHKIPETNEMIILPVPGYCDVDKPFTEEETADKNGKTKIKIIPIKNKIKSFGRFSDKVIMSFAIAEFSKENPDQIVRIQRVISPKYYQQTNARIRLISYEVKDGSNLEALKPEDASRFAWINGRALETTKYPWGNYKTQDKGVYAAFGVFIYPEKIWSKIPVVNDFIAKAAKENSDETMLYMASNDEKWKKLGLSEAIKKAQYYLANSQSDYSLSRYIGSLGINEIDTSVARVMTHGTNIMRKGKDGKWVVAEGMEKKWQELVEQSNYRDYYYPFTYDQKEKLWEIDESKKGWLVIEKITDFDSTSLEPKAYSVDKYLGKSQVRMSHDTYNSKWIMIYNKISKELILRNNNSATHLK